MSRMHEWLADGLLITDGAWGTELQARGLPPGAMPDTCALSVSQPMALATTWTLTTPCLARKSEANFESPKATTRMRFLSASGGAFSSFLASGLLSGKITRDRKFLADRGYPLMKEAAQFFLDYMVEHPKYGWLVTGPSVSPENFFRTADGQTSSESMGPTCDRVLVYDLFTSCIEGSRILGRDADFRARLEAARAKLPPLKVGKHGQLL